jgi:hypothetical protein
MEVLSQFLSLFASSALLRFEFAPVFQERVFPNISLYTKSSQAGILYSNQSMHILLYRQALIAWLDVFILLSNDNEQRMKFTKQQTDLNGKLIISSLLSRKITSILVNS